MSIRMNAKNLKDLSMFTPYDVSKWCQERGIQSVYLEYQTERIMEVQWEYLRTPRWVVKDAKTPGVILKKFVLQHGSNIKETRERARAWVEAKYDTPMREVTSMRSLFPTLAVDMIENELDMMVRVWGKDPAESLQISSIDRKRILGYGKPHFVKGGGDILVRSA